MLAADSHIRRLMALDMAIQREHRKRAVACSEYEPILNDLDNLELMSCGYEFRIRQLQCPIFSESLNDFS